MELGSVNVIYRTYFHGFTQMIVTRLCFLSGDLSYGATDRRRSLVRKNSSVTFSYAPCDENKS